MGYTFKQIVNCEITYRFAENNLDNFPSFSEK